MCETKPNLGETFGLSRSGTCPTGGENYDQSQFWRIRSRADAWAWTHFGCSGVVMGAKITFKANFHSRIRPPRLHLGCGHSSTAAGFHRGENYVQSQFSRGTNKLKAYSTKLDILRLHAGCQKFEIAIAQPPCQGGRARCFESWMTLKRQTTKLCHGIDSCFTDAEFPLADAWGCWLQWAVTPKLTMIDGRQLSIGALSV